MDKQDSEIEKRFINVNQSKTFRNIVSYFTLDKNKVFDIGASYGEFLAHFGEGSVGLSISQDEVDYAKRKGLDMRYGNIESEIPVSEKFDVVFANNIFEHLYSPHKFLVDIKKYVKEDGILILGVPCIPKVVQLLRFGKFRGSLAVSHINFFTRESLKFTVNRAGWNVESMRSFHFKNRILDWLLNPVAPHFYVIARVDKNFSYDEKRLKELRGYTHLS